MSNQPLFLTRYDRALRWAIAALAIALVLNGILSFAVSAQDVGSRVWFKTGCLSKTAIEQVGKAYEVGDYAEADAIYRDPENKCFMTVQNGTPKPGTGEVLEFFEPTYVMPPGSLTGQEFLRVTKVMAWNGSTVYVLTPAPAVEQPIHGQDV